MKKLLIALLALCLCGASALAAELTTNGGVEIDLSALPHQDEAAPATVYFISDISPESLTEAYQALGVQLPGKVGVKLSTGESERANYLRPALIGDLVQMLNGAIVECNTAYGGSRASTAMHMQLAKDHGFTDIAEVLQQWLSDGMSMGSAAAFMITRRRGARIFDSTVRGFSLCEKL